METKSSFTQEWKITACRAVCRVFNSLTHFSLVCGLCSHSYLCSLEIKFLCRPFSRLTMDHVIKNTERKKHNKKKNCFPALKFCFRTFATQWVLHSLYFETLMNRSIFDSGNKTFPGWHLERGKTKPVLYGSHSFEVTGRRIGSW